MYTYHYAHTNSSAAIALSAASDREAQEQLTGLVKDWREWRFSGKEDEDE